MVGVMCTFLRLQILLNVYHYDMYTTLFNGCKVFDRNIVITATKEIGNLLFIFFGGGVEIEGYVVGFFCVCV